MASGRLFIIGIDGVDLTVAREKDLLLSETVKWDLEEFPKLHTLRIWPSMFLGSPPHKDDDRRDPISHSRSDRDEERLTRANWGSPTMRYLSKISHLLLPERVRVSVGESLQYRGILTAHEVEWSDTVFDSLLSKAINIPTYDPLPTQRKLKTGWKTRIREGDAGLEELHDFAREERETVASELDDALDHGYDLTWAYVYCPDIFGHVDYDYGYPRTVERVRDEVIEPVRERLDEHDQLVIVTDHGMENRDGAGEHRPPGWFTTDTAGQILPSRPAEVRPWIEEVVGQQSHNKEEVLQDLGYI